MLDRVIFDLFPSRCGIWDLGTADEVDAAIISELVGSAYSTADMTGEIKVDDAARDRSRSAYSIIAQAQAKLAELASEEWNVVCTEAHGIVREHGIEIAPHSDSDLAHVQCHYFPMGEERDYSQALIAQANRRTSNSVVICSSDTRAGLYGASYLPWERMRHFYLTPVRGLLIFFDARLLHFQRPFLGDGRFVQLVMNFRFEKKQGEPCIN